MAGGASPSDFSRWEELLEQGREPSEAANSLGLTCSAFKRADPERHAKALLDGQEARGYYVDRRLEKWIDQEAASPQVQLAWARRWNPAYRDKVAVTGAQDGPVEFVVRSAFDAGDGASAAVRGDPETE